MVLKDFIVIRRFKGSLIVFIWILGNLEVIFNDFLDLYHELFDGNKKNAL